MKFKKSITILPQVNGLKNKPLEMGFLFLGKSAIINKTDIERTNADF